MLLLFYIWIMFLFSAITAMLDCSFPSLFPPSSFSPASIPAFWALYAYVSVGGEGFFLLRLHCFPISAREERKREKDRKALSLFCGVFYTCPFVDRISTKCIQFKIAVRLTCVHCSHVFHYYLDFFFCLFKKCSFDVGIRPAVSISGGACLQSVDIRQYFQHIYAYTFCLCH